MPHLVSLSVVLTLLSWLTAASPAWPAVAFVPPAAVGPASLCRAATASAEVARHVPQAFLAAIARVESGRTDPATGLASPWPWTVNAEGVGSFYDTKADAVAAVRALQARGVRSIDVGCLQVNLLHHPEAFASLEQAFDPAANAAYAAGFLASLFDQTGSWPRAAAAYHSQTPTLGAPYEKRVLAEWALPEDGREAAPARRARAHPEPAAEPARPPAPGGVSLAAIVPNAISPAGRMPPQIQRSTPPMQAPGPMGRTLAAYRLMPARMAWRAVRPG